MSPDAPEAVPKADIPPSPGPATDAAPPGSPQAAPSPKDPPAGAEPGSPAALPPSPAPTQPAAPQARSGRWIGLALLGAFVVAVTLHVLFDRYTPYTSEAALQAPIVGVAPSVSGEIVEVGVQDNQPVSVGDLLFRIDPRRYAAAVAQAEANLTDVSQRVGASTAALSAAEARVLEANANLLNQREQTSRVLVLVQRNVYSQAQADTSRAQLATAGAAVQSAVASLDEARRRLGPTGTDNPQIQQALAALQRARIDLRDTEVRAPVDGVVTNTVLAVGQYASAGHRMATIIDTASAWVVANVPENALARIRPGDRAAITFNVEPGLVFPGHVGSIASGVSQGLGGTMAAELPFVAERRRWLRQTQRIPVRIELEHRDDAPAIRVGSRASIVVFTDDHGLLAPLAGLWLRTVSLVDYFF